MLFTKTHVLVNEYVILVITIHKVQFYPTLTFLKGID